MTKHIRYPIQEWTEEYGERYITINKSIFYMNFSCLPRYGKGEFFRPEFFLPLD